MNHVPPAARAPAQVPVKPGAAAVPHSLREHSLALGRSHVRDRAIFRGALDRLLCSPPVPQSPFGFQLVAILVGPLKPAH
jgi:hypothetical protein